MQSCRGRPDQCCCQRPRAALQDMGRSAGSPAALQRVHTQGPSHTGSVGTSPAKQRRQLRTPGQAAPRHGDMLHVRPTTREEPGHGTPLSGHAHGSHAELWQGRDGLDKPAGRQRQHGSTAAGGAAAPAAGHLRDSLSRQASRTKPAHPGVSSTPNIKHSKASPAKLSRVTRKR